MTIPPNAVIDRKKLTEYLLVYKEVNDKSLFLAKAGFTSDNPDELERAIRRQAAENFAVEDRVDEYGVYFLVTGPLRGTIDLRVVTVWIYEAATERFRFVTLKPYKG